MIVTIKDNVTICNYLSVLLFFWGGGEREFLNEYTTGVREWKEWDVLILMELPRSSLGVQLSSPVCNSAKTFKWVLKQFSSP